MWEGIEEDRPNCRQRNEFKKNTGRTSKRSKTTKNEARESSPKPSHRDMSSESRFPKPIHIPQSNKSTWPNPSTRRHETYPTSRSIVDRTILVQKSGKHVPHCTAVRLSVAGHCRRAESSTARMIHLVAHRCSHRNFVGVRAGIGSGDYVDGDAVQG